MSDDIQTLDLILSLLGEIDDRTFDDGYETLRSVKAILTGAKRIAEHKMRRDYLSGQQGKQKERKYEIVNVWEQG